MRRIYSAIIPAMISACVAAPPPRPAPPQSMPGAPFTLSQREIAVIEDGVRAVLKDPASATFTGIKASASEKEVVTACGFVNAKNSFGGYTGFYPFSGILTGAPEHTGFFALVSTGQPADVQAMLNVCAKAGIYLQ